MIFRAAPPDSSISVAASPCLDGDSSCLDRDLARLVGDLLAPRWRIVLPRQGSNRASVQKFEPRWRFRHASTVMFRAAAPI